MSKLASPGFSDWLVVGFLLLEKWKKTKQGVFRTLPGRLARLLVAWLVLSATSPASAGSEAAWKPLESWIFRPARYSHFPGTSHRLVQYQSPPPAVVPTDPTYQESGYRHKRSGIAVRGSFDFRHVVETWGAGEAIRPYGEWLYPFRPGATPFGPWGNPQGPWTLPFQSWQNPYGAWNRYGYPSGMIPLPIWPPASSAPQQ